MQVRIYCNNEHHTFAAVQFKDYSFINGLTHKEKAVMSINVFHKYSFSKTAIPLADIKNMLIIYGISYRDAVHTLILFCMLLIMVYIAVAPFLHYVSMVSL